VFVANYNCTGDVKMVREARKSFVSGHASYSFYCATFLVIYLQTRLNPDPKNVTAYVFSDIPTYIKT
jgi:membrane-associated phospholipid phosphatase